MSEHRNNTFEEIWDMLMKAERIVVPLHKDPDPDSLGSAIATALVLSELQKEVHIISTDKVPHFPSLASLYEVNIKDPSTVDLEKYDVFLAQDIAGVNRYSKNPDFRVPGSLPIIVIDHHKTNPKFGNVNFVDPSYLSTAEILYDLFASQSVKITQKIAIALLFGIVADTGWFAYGPTARTFDTAKALVQYGADTRVISAELNQTSIPELNIQGIMYAKITKDDNGNFAYSYVSLEDITKAGVANESYQSGSHIFKYISGIDFGVVITEQAKGIYRGSLRTREAHTFDVSKVAAAMSGSEHGGGHQMAAGFEMKAKSVDEVLNRMREVVKDLQQ